MRTRLWSVSILAFVALAVLNGAPPQAPAGNVGFRFTTDEAFDAATIPPYGGRHDEVYAHIDANLAEHVAQLQRWVRQPSVSAQNRGIPRWRICCAATSAALGFQEAALVPDLGSPGRFGLLRRRRAEDARGLHDVRRAAGGDRLERAGLRRARSWTRRSARCSWRAARPTRRVPSARSSTRSTPSSRRAGKLPVNLMVVAEGEEELGSPHFPEVDRQVRSAAEDRRRRLLPLDVRRTPTGAVSLPLGVKGILRSSWRRGAARRAGRRRPRSTARSRPWWTRRRGGSRRRSAALTTPDGNTILVPGYYDAIRPPTLEEQRLVNGIAARSGRRSEEAMRKALARRAVRGRPARPRSAGRLALHHHAEHQRHLGRLHRARA